MVREDLHAHGSYRSSPSPSPSPDAAEARAENAPAVRSASSLHRVRISSTNERRRSSSSAPSPSSPSTRSFATVLARMLRRPARTVRRGAAATTATETMAESRARPRQARGPTAPLPPNIAVGFVVATPRPLIAVAQPLADGPEHHTPITVLYARIIVPMAEKCEDPPSTSVPRDAGTDRRTRCAAAGRSNPGE